MKKALGGWSYWKIGGVWAGTGLSQPGVQPVEDAYALPVPPRLLELQVDNLRSSGPSPSACEC